MPLIPMGEGFTHSEAFETDRQLREGDGMGWPGDPMLSLHIGIRTAKKSGFDKNIGRWVRAGDEVARRYEVWRHCEDGVDRIIGAWKMEDHGQIIFDLAMLRMDAPNHELTIDKLEASDARREKENSDKFAEAAGPALDHLASIKRELDGRNFFGYEGEPKESKLIVPTSVKDD